MTLTKNGWRKLVAVTALLEKQSGRTVLEVEAVEKALDVFLEMASGSMAARLNDMNSMKIIEGAEQVLRNLAKAGKIPEPILLEVDETGELVEVKEHKKLH